MLYIINNSETDIIDNAIYAESLTEAEYKAYCTYGEDAIGCNIKGENGDFMASVCKSVWERLLKDEFKGFAMEDVLKHLELNAYAWLTFGYEKHYDYFEECEMRTLTAEGKAYLFDNDNLGNYMRGIGFEW